MKSIAKNIYQHQDDKTKCTVIVKKNGSKKKRTFTSSSKVKSIMIKEAQKHIIDLKESFETKNIEASTLDELFEHYINQPKQARYKASKSSSYNQYISKKLGKMNIKDIKPKQIEKIYDELSGEVKDSTAKQVTKVLLSPVFSFGIGEGLITSNPAKGVSIKGISTKKIVHDAQKEFNDVTVAISELESPLHRAFLTFALYTTRRKSEIQSLAWGNINFENDSYTVTTKGAIEQTFKMHPKAKEAINSLPRLSTNVFVNPDTKKPLKYVETMVNHIKLKTGIKRYSLHYNRNLTATYLFNKGVPTNQISAMLGHRNYNTLLNYLSIDTMHGSEQAIKAF